MMRAPLLALTALIAAAGCSKPPTLTVSDARVNLPAVAGQPAVAYFTLHGGPTADRLILVTADYALRSEIHQSMKSGTMASMKPVEGGVALPAGGTVEFKPGGLHVMLFGVRPDLKPPSAMPLMLRFASGPTLTIQAELKDAGNR